MRAFVTIHSATLTPPWRKLSASVTTKARVAAVFVAAVKPDLFAHSMARDRRLRGSVWREHRVRVRSAGLSVTGA
jgi:hypothetical protein